LILSDRSSIFLLILDRIVLASSSENSFGAEEGRVTPNELVSVISLLDDVIVKAWPLLSLFSTFGINCRIFPTPSLLSAFTL
jgi:hypothetical protein